MILLKNSLDQLTDEQLIGFSVDERKCSHVKPAEPTPYRLALDAEMIRRGLLVAEQDR